MATLAELKKMSGLTKEEFATIDFNTKLLGKLIEARNSQGITQKQMEELTGIKQPAIARLEKGNANPRVDTILKLLNSLGYTLEIVPISKKRAG